MSTVMLFLFIYFFKYSEGEHKASISSFFLLEETGSKNRAFLCILQIVRMSKELSPSDADVWVWFSFCVRAHRCEEDFILDVSFKRYV